MNFNKLLNHPELQYNRLDFPSFSSKLFIKIVTWKKLKYFRLRAVVGKKRCQESNLLIYQLHLRHYMHNVLFGGLVTPRNIMYRFILSRADENIRLAAISLENNNTLGFYLALRSQIELNAHVNYLSNDEGYAQTFLGRPENRKKDHGNPELIKNVATLVQKFEKKFIIYMRFYDYCSTLIHPNPSTVLKGAKPQKNFNDKVKVDMDYKFESAWFSTDAGHLNALEWFDYFLKISGHLLRLFDDLDEKIDIDSKDVKVESGSLGLFFDLARKQEVFNLRAKMERWSQEEYDKRQNEFMSKIMSKENLEMRIVKDGKKK